MYSHGESETILGPRTLDQLESQLGAAAVELDESVLDRIDEIVAPGTNVNPTDAGWTIRRSPPRRDGDDPGARLRAGLAAGVTVTARPR